MALTHCVCGEFWGVVVDISDPHDGGGCVGQTVGGVSLHVGGLDDQGVLGDFLKAEQKEKHSSGACCSTSLIHYYQVLKKILIYHPSLFMSDLQKHTYLTLQI